MRYCTFHVIAFFILLGIFSCGEECDPNRQYVGKDYRTYCNTPAWDLVKALEEEDLSTAKTILSYDSRLVNYQDPKYRNSILFWATLNENEDDVNFLLQNGAKVDNLNSDQNSPIELASFNYTDCESKILDSLIHYLPKDTEKAQLILNKALIGASSRPCLRKLGLLLVAGASPNFSFDDGGFVGLKSVLSTSVIHRRYENLKFLLQCDSVSPAAGTISRRNGDTVTLKQLLLEDLEESHSDQEKIRPIILDLVAKIDSLSSTD